MGWPCPVEWADIMRRPLKPVLLLFFYTIEVITASGSLPPIPDTVLHTRFLQRKAKPSFFTTMPPF